MERCWTCEKALLEDSQILHFCSRDCQESYATNKTTNKITPKQQKREEKSEKIYAPHMTEYKENKGLLFLGCIFFIIGVMTIFYSVIKDRFFLIIFGVVFTSIGLGFFLARRSTRKEHEESLKRITICPKCSMKSLLAPNFCNQCSFLSIPIIKQEKHTPTKFTINYNPSFLTYKIKDENKQSKMIADKNWKSFVGIPLGKRIKTKPKWSWQLRNQNGEIIGEIRNPQANPWRRESDALIINTRREIRDGKEEILAIVNVSHVNMAKQKKRSISAQEYFKKFNVITPYDVYSWKWESNNIDLSDSNNTLCFSLIRSKKRLYGAFSTKATIKSTGILEPTLTILLGVSIMMIAPADKYSRPSN